MKDQRGVVYLETLVAFLPVFLFFLATLQIADLSAAHIIVRHAATVAARAAVVVMPDDGRYYNDEDNEKLHAFDGLRRQDIEHAADLILRANPRLDNAPSNVVVGFQSPPTPPPPSPNRFACPPGAPQPCMSRDEVLAAAFDSQTAGELLDTSTKGEGDWGMREKLDALVTAKYRCMLRFFCPRDFTMVATASLLYQGARYTYEAWPDSIRSDGRTGSTPAAPVGPASQIPGGPPGNGNAPGGQTPSDPGLDAPPGNAPTDPGALPSDAVAGQTPAAPGSTGSNGSNGSSANPGVSDPVASAPPGSTRPGGQVGSGSTTALPPAAAGPGATNSGSNSAGPSTSNSNGAVASNAPPTSASGSSRPGPATSNNPGANISTSPTAPTTGAIASNAPVANNAQGATVPGAQTTPGANANNGSGVVASNNNPGSSSNGNVGPTQTTNNSTANNESSLTSNNTGSRTPSSGARPSIVAREPTDSDSPTVAPSNSGNAQEATAAGSSNSDGAHQTAAHGAVTPANAEGRTRGNTQTAANTASNGRTGTNSTRGPPGSATNAGRDTRGVITGAVTSEQGSGPTIPGSDRNNSNTPASSASIIASGPDPNGQRAASNAANRGSRAPRNEAALRAQLPSDIRNVPIVSDPSLPGNTVRAHYTYDARGRVTGVELRVGPNAQPRHIADHVTTVRTLQGYQGLAGRVRLVLDKLNAWIAGHPNTRPGSLAWETRREVEKLQAIIDARTRALNGANLTPAQRTELENERSEYARQLAQHEANLNTITHEPGRGYVAAEDTGSAQTPSIAAQGWNPPSEFNQIPAHRLPPLLPGWAWRRTEAGVWTPVRPPGVAAAEFDVQVYGPDSDGIVDANLILRNPAPGVAEVILSATGTTRRGQSPARPSVNTSEYQEVVADARPETQGAILQDRQGNTIEEFVRDANGNIVLDSNGNPQRIEKWDLGHVQEHADTIPNPGGPTSTGDRRRNFVPEPGWWNQRVRSPLVGGIRRRGNGYMQYFEYDSNPRRTADGTAVPSAEYFIEVARNQPPVPDGTILGAWRIPFDADPSLTRPPGVPSGPGSTNPTLAMFEVTDHSTLPQTPVIE